MVSLIFFKQYNFYLGFFKENLNFRFNSLIDFIT